MKLVLLSKLTQASAYERTRIPSDLIVMSAAASGDDLLNVSAGEKEEEDKSWRSYTSIRASVLEQVLSVGSWIKGR